MAYILTNVGKEVIVDRLMGNSAEPKYIGWGTGSTAAAEADTALETAAAEARVAGTTSKVTTTTPNDTFRVVGSLVAAAGRNIREVGLFTALTNGVLFIHGSHGLFELATGDTIQYTIDTIFDGA